MAEKGKKGKISPGLAALNKRRQEQHQAETKLATLKLEEQIANQKTKTEDAKSKERLAEILANKNYKPIEDLIDIAMASDTSEAMKVKIAMKFLDKDIGNMKNVDLQKGAKANIHITLQSFKGAKAADCSLIITDKPIEKDEYNEFISEHDEDYGLGEGDSSVEGETVQTVIDIEEGIDGETQEEQEAVGSNEQGGQERAAQADDDLVREV